MTDPVITIVRRCVEDLLALVGHDHAALFIEGRCRDLAEQMERVVERLEYRVGVHSQSQSLVDRLEEAEKRADSWQRERGAIMAALADADIECDDPVDGIRRLAESDAMGDDALAERDERERVIDAVKDRLGIEREWSNLYGYFEFIEEVEGVLHRLRSSGHSVTGLNSETDKSKDTSERLRAFQETYCAMLDVPGMGKAAVPRFVAAYVERLREASIQAEQRYLNETGQLEKDLALIRSGPNWRERLRQLTEAEEIAKEHSKDLPDGLWRWTWDPACYTLRRHSGDPAATVWTNGTWHTWDVAGIGGENSSESTVEAAMREALASVIHQGWDLTPPQCPACDGLGFVDEDPSEEEDISPARPTLYKGSIYCDECDGDLSEHRCRCCGADLYEGSAHLVMIPRWVIDKAESQAISEPQNINEGGDE